MNFSCSKHSVGILFTERCPTIGATYSNNMTKISSTEDISSWEWCSQLCWIHASCEYWIWERRVDGKNGKCTFATQQWNTTVSGANRIGGSRHCKGACTELPTLIALGVFFS